MLRSRPDKPGRRFPRAFTLIELMLVMALLAIVTALVAPSMLSFFHGRALNEEAERLLTLTQYARSRAIAEGVPVVLWIDSAKSAYGQNIQTGFVTTDDHASSFALESSLTIDAPNRDAPPVSELGDETLGLPPGLPVIRFLPDGFIDFVSTTKIVLHQGTEAALELVPTPDRLGYEILPYTAG
ncbi:MAG: GspH/FimT family pseudopilin [Opitutales bacterium]